MSEETAKRTEDPAKYYVRVSMPENVRGPALVDIVGGSCIPTATPVRAYVGTVSARTDTLTRALAKVIHSGWTPLGTWKAHHEHYYCEIQRHPNGRFQREPVIYAARPVGVFGTRYDRRSLAALAGYFPNAEIADPALLFTSDAEWLDRWPTLVREIDLLVVWADEEGHIGVGCLKEITDSIIAGVPVVSLDKGGKLRRLGGIRPNYSPRYPGQMTLTIVRRLCAQLAYGPVVPVAELTELTDARPLVSL